MVPTGERALVPDAQWRSGVTPEQVESHAAQARDVLGTVALAQAAVISGVFSMSCRCFPLHGLDSASVSR